MGVFVAHTDPTDFTDFLLMVGNLTEAGGGVCLSAPISKAHTDSARFNKKIICGNLC